MYTRETGFMRQALRCYLVRRNVRPAELISENGMSAAKFYRRVNDAFVEENDPSNLPAASDDHEVVVVVFASFTASPWWQKALAEDVELEGFVVPDQAARGALVLTSATDPEGGPHRWIAWTFGIASRYLDRSRMQPRFGVVAALNRVIGDGGEDVLLKKLQVQQQGAYRQRIGHVAARNIPVYGFRMDQLRDLLWAAGGKPEDDEAEVFGSRNYFYRADIDGLVDTLIHQAPVVMELYRQDAYKSSFSFLDNYFPVDDSEVEAELRELLVVELLENQGNVDFVYPDDLLSFGEDRAIHHVLFPGEHAHDWKRLTVTVEAVRELVVDDPLVGLGQWLRFFDQDDEFVGRATIFECLTAEVVLDETRYVLADGTFYEVNNDFIAALDQSLEALPVWPEELSRYGGGTERSWIDEAGEGEYGILDGTRIYPPTNSAFEPADLVHVSGALVFAKRKGKSSALSYLATQAAAACQLLGEPSNVDKLMDLVHDHIREDLREPIEQALQALRQNAPELPVVFAILGDWNNKTVRNLPLIARIELLSAADTIRQLGFRPHVALVHSVTED